MFVALLVVVAGVPTCGDTVIETPLRFAKGMGSRKLPGEQDVFVTIRHLDDNTENKSSVDQLSERGFVVLRPALHESQDSMMEGQRQFEELLQARRAQDAVELLIAHLASRRTLGIDKFVCAAPEVRHAAPGGTWGNGSKAQVGSSAEWSWGIWFLIQVVPAAAQLLRLWVPIRSSVQPLAFVDARTWDPSQRKGLEQEAARHHPGQRWWYTNVSLGAAVVLDALRTPRASFMLPGEVALARLHAAAIALKAKVSRDMSPGKFEDACADLDTKVFDPLPFPAVGERYRVLLEPSALLRKEESQESDVVGEIRPGGVVTVLEIGKEEHGRAKVYTEQALLSQMQPVGDGSEISSASRPVGGATAWIRTIGYDGSRLLKPLRTPEDGEPSDSMVRQIESLGGLLRGICGSKGSLNADRILKRNIEALEIHLEAGRHFSLEVECLALTIPPWNEAFRCAVALVVTVLTAYAGSFALRSSRFVWSSRELNMASSRPHFLPPPMS